jgi:hypothetical protein
MEDLQSTTRYVTWSLHTKSRSSLKSMLSKVTTGGPGGSGSGGGGGHQHGGKGGGAGGASEAGGATADFLENTLWNRTLGAMSEEIVAALVCQIFEGELDWVQLEPAACMQRRCCRLGSCCLELIGCRGSNCRTRGGHARQGLTCPSPLPCACACSFSPCSPPSAGIRDHFVQSVELKFNCFFLMPIIDTFPTRLREELESAYDEDLDEVRRAGGSRAEMAAA